jgi:peptide/nickel transport system substrate-binding protein
MTLIPRPIGDPTIMNRLHRLRAPLVLTACAGLSLSACSSGGGSSAGGGLVYTTVSGLNPITAGAPMNPFNASGNAFVSFDVMQLGFDKQNPLNPDDFFPGLAASWTTTPDSITVKLQPNAKWSDGTPVTPDDVKLSMAIALTQGNATVGAGFLTQGLDVGSVVAVDPGTVEIRQAPGGHNLDFARLVLGQPIVPSSVYGSLVPASVWSTISQLTGSDPATANAAMSRLTAIGKTVSSYAPAKDVSAGPFVIARINPGSAELKKNPYFYGAAGIAPSEVILRHYSGNSDIWSYMKSGELDSAPYTAMPTNILDEVDKAGYAPVDTASFVDASLAFNESTSPYDLTPVRQALAHVIDRQAVTKVGEPVSGTAATDLDGMIESATKQWLTPAQTARLDPYAPDQAKAASLLESAGLSKSGGQWLLPNGRPWKITLQSVNGFSDWNAAATVIASELSSFGIPTQVQLTADFATYKTDMAAGKYAVGFWLIALGPTASAAYQRLYGADDGFTAGPDGTVTHSDGGGNWQHTPTAYTVDGSTINPGLLTAQLATLPASQQKALVAQLAAATNEQLPVIPIWDYTNVNFTYGKRFTDFPNQSSPDINGLMYNQPGVWMMQGYVKAK